MRVDASPPSPHRVAAILCVAFLAACHGDDPVQVDGPSFAKPVAPNCTDTTVLDGTSPLTIQAIDQSGDPVQGFTASVFNSCGRIRVGQDGEGEVEDGAITFDFAAGAEVFVLAQGGVTVAAASLEFVPPTDLGGLEFGDAPLNAARMTVAGQGNTILSEVPTLSLLEAAVSNPPVSVKNSGTTVVMTIPEPTDADSDNLLEGVRQIRPFNLTDEAALPIVAIQVLESPPTARGCGLFTSTNVDLCLSGEGVGVIRGLDLMDPASEDFATLATAELDGLPSEDCVIEVLGVPANEEDQDQGLLTASALCNASTGIDENDDGIEEIFLFARPAFCDLSATETALDEVGDGSVFDFLSLQVGAVAAGPYPGGTFPDPNAIAVIGDGLLRVEQDVTLTLTVKEVLADGGSSVRSINVALKPNITCTSDDVEAPAFCVPDPRGLAGETGTLVLWNILVDGLQTGSVREVAMNVKGQDAIPDPDKSAGARILVPGLPSLTEEDVCAVEEGGGRFSPIGG